MRYLILMFTLLFSFNVKAEDLYCFTRVEVGEAIGNSNFYERIDEGAWDWESFVVIDFDNQFIRARNSTDLYPLSKITDNIFQYGSYTYLVSDDRRYVNEVNIDDEAIYSKVLNCYATP